MRNHTGPVALVFVALFCSTGIAAAADHPQARNVADMKLGTVPGLPTCATGAVQSGDPRSGPSVIYSQMAAGCEIPWHWHTPTETLMIVSGTATVEAKDAKPSTLRQGAFAVMPSHHVHRFRCEAACSLYVSSDVAFDIHYMNAGGNEISPDDAMKPLKQKAAKPPQ
jgi:quercetin dioxygenase-like cupin family protein